jgi:histidinol-phosphate aminotransferase
MSLKLRQAVRASSGYTPSWQGENSSAFLRLDRNELTQPISSTALRAVTQFAETVGAHLYPEAAELAVDIARYCGIPPDCVVVTHGCDQAINVVLQSILLEGDTLLIATPEFPMFTHFAQLIGTRVAGVPYLPDLSFPYADFTDAIAATSPDIIAVINPNNPTGTPVALDFIEMVAASCPNTPVVVDEAYFEFTGKTVVSLIERLDNLIVLRTFSKAFGLAGMRVGYLAATAPVAQEISKLVGPYDANALAVAAARAQLAALDEVQDRVREIMEEVKPALLDYYASVGDEVWPGAANFILVKPSVGTGVVDRLRAHGILVQRMRAPALSGMFRMSLGRPDEMQRFIEAYERCCGR